jgi:deoxypyrimidine-specific 5' nucleotidase type C protein (NT5C)
MPLRIAFDMDGVLANMNAAVDRVAVSMFEDLEAGANDVAPDQAGDASDELDANLARVALTPRQQRQLSRRLSTIENFWDTLEELEAGAVAELGRMAAERRWEVIFLTKRPATAGDTAQVQTQRWLQRHGFSMPSVFVVNGSRGRIASALSLDFVVDDRPESCLDVVLESRAKAILVWREKDAEVPQKARRLGISVVSNLAECLTLLVHVDEIHDKPGMLGRLKRLLGIEREPSLGA